jgi:uncharacterized protein YqgV (UPF0045/DUF77 family)
LLGSAPRRVGVTRSVYSALAAEITELRGDPQTLDLMRTSVEGNVETIFDAIQHEIPLDHNLPSRH